MSDHKIDVAAFDPPHGEPLQPFSAAEFVDWWANTKADRVMRFEALRRLQPGPPVMTPKEKAIAAIRALFDKAEDLEDLTGEVLATLKLNYQRGTLTENHPGTPAFHEILERWQARFERIGNAAPTEPPPVVELVKLERCAVHYFDRKTWQCLKCGIRRNDLIPEPTQVPAAETSLGICNDAYGNRYPVHVFNTATNRCIGCGIARNLAELQATQERKG